MDVKPQAIFSGTLQLNWFRSLYAMWFLVTVATAGLGLFFVVPRLFMHILETRTTSYTVTNEKIDIESGIVTKSFNTLELWRITDMQLQQKLLQRIFGECSISVASQDQTHPVLVFSSFPIEMGREIFGKLQSALSEARKRGRTVGVIQ